MLLYFGIEFKDTIGVIRSCKSKRNIHYNGQKINKERPNTSQKNKDWARRSPLNPGVNSCASEGLALPAPLMTPVVLLLNDKNII